jgi:hypothetical protein
MSGIDVLDIDSTKHVEAADWHKLHLANVSTRTHQTRSGGYHYFFQHQRGLRNRAGIYTRSGPHYDWIPGIDIRADGGCIIYWPASGFPVLNEGPIAPWPLWLLRSVTTEPPAPKIDLNLKLPEGQAGADLIDQALNEVLSAPTGARNDILNRTCYRLQHKYGHLNLFTEAEIISTFTSAAMSIGLNAIEINSTIKSALRGSRRA